MKFPIIVFFIVYSISCFGYMFTYDWDINPEQYFGFSLQGLIGLGIATIIYYISKDKGTIK